MPIDLDKEARKKQLQREIAIDVGLKTDIQNGKLARVELDPDNYKDVSLDPDYIKAKAKKERIEEGRLVQKSLVDQFAKTSDSQTKILNEILSVAKPLAILPAGNEDALMPVIGANGQLNPDAPLDMAIQFTHKSLSDQIADLTQALNSAPSGVLREDDEELYDAYVLKLQQTLDRKRQDLELTEFIAGKVKLGVTPPEGKMEEFRQLVTDNIVKNVPVNATAEQKEIANAIARFSIKRERLQTKGRVAQNLDYDTAFASRYEDDPDKKYLVDATKYWFPNAEVPCFMYMSSEGILVQRNMDGDLVTGFKPTPGLVRLLFGTNQEILGQKEPTASSSKNQGGIHVVRGLGVTGRGSPVIPFGNNKFEHLSDEEAIMLNKLFTSAGVTPSPSQAKELARTNGGRVFVESIKDLRAKLSVLLGEVQAGNTSVEVKNDIANIANFLNSRKVLAKKKLAEILEFIHNAVIPYSWTNISAELGNNTYQYNNGSTLRTVTMPDGMYSYEAMDQYLRATMDSNSDYDTDVNGFRVYHIRFYTNTVLNKLSVVIDGGYSLIIPNTPFKVTTGLTPGTYTTSVSSQTLPVINTANQVSLRCSLVSNPYANPDELFRFSPDVPPTDIIHLEPVNLQWTPCSNGGFREISISVHDENGTPITLVDKKISYTLKFRVPIVPEKI
ncbi:hypothetical protein CAOG_05166 [Capsaspora owczarzaki ATCC 30864]|uniref:Uncharacterized protein n=1 Tax=Capsaspora owczarzaki (strain ATCC 30864) TaxID=595528 RepID=A0A0D2WSR2_CAPO3|nr:hypothetical protein CAOG_05166 [Capsaspora owczarzaki ATCC 30864]KJE94533.1 hypothetical protein CAOG_005166 [Capsaspora owczarzaki ATCC 30864]|eukprot:XP_004346851.1 hypothetical protein CAOG_05166 [Capsaspora owczarzaki ATCC 30864]